MHTAPKFMKMFDQPGLHRYYMSTLPTTRSSVCVPELFSDLPLVEQSFPAAAGSFLHSP